jgi:hypothetical protein
MLTLGHSHSSGGNRDQRAQNSAPKITQNNFSNHNFCCSPARAGKCNIKQRVYVPEVLQFERVDVEHGWHSVIVQVVHLLRIKYG